MAVSPPLNPPRLGDPVGGGFGYVKRASAERQAGYFNIVLADDPALGPSCGLVVGVSPIKDQDGYYPLVWVAAP
ncbi:hypothetical protein AAHS21_14665 [Mycobacterium sp. 050272]|uniref:hypothetical protein n=1 Tax=Mycobacterium sp. 050272 TaxID=3142488 RepID=UPI003197C4DE